MTSLTHTGRGSGFSVLQKILRRTHKHFSSITAMSMLTFLPRMTSWGSDHRRGEVETIRQEAGQDVQGWSQSSTKRVTNNVSEELKDEVYGYQMRYEIGGSPQKKKQRRRKISYWTDEEAVTIKSSR